MVSKYRFKGHETFVLREGWLNKGLNEVKKNPRVFSENYGADALGVGPNMAKSIRYWLRCADLIEDSGKNGVALTDIGRLILEHDPYIEDMFTLWLVHCRIAENCQLATAWYLFFEKFSYEEFDRDRLCSEMIELVALLPNSGEVAESSIVADCDAILRMYVPRRERELTPEEKNVSPFGKLGILRESSGIYERRQPDLNRLPDEIVRYLLAESLAGRTSVYLDDLLQLSGGPGKLLGLRRTGMLEMLERLEQKESITINRTAGLNMIYLNEQLSGTAVVEAYYHGTNDKTGKNKP